MGAYLSEPIVQKLSSDELNEFLQVGASSMQGWRISQEDAHNCVLKFDENTSLFAVYDGHGGSEVATYCADKLPDFLKNLQSYQDKDIEKALKEAFIKFDSTLLDEKVIEVLKTLAGDRHQVEDATCEEEEEEDLEELCEEGALPLETVLAKYKANAPGAMLSLPHLNKMKDEDPTSAGSSKPLSPCLRGRRRCDGDNAGASCSSYIKSKIDGVIEDGIVSSSASESCAKKLEHNDDEIKSNEAAPSSKNGVDETVVAKVSDSPDSSVIVAAEKIQNGEPKALEVTGVSSSSSASSSIALETSKPAVENGEISSASSPKSKIVALPGKSSQRVQDRARRNGSSSGISSSIEPDDSSTDSDTDFQAEDESESDEDDTKAGDDEDDTEDDDDDENEDDDDDLDEDAYKDEQFCANMVEEPGKDSGCTAVLALLHGRDLYVANAGDSRCVVCRNGKAIDMSVDHKPEDTEEMLRISNAGGRVTLDGRVNGGLNLSRAIGDHAYKMNATISPEEQMISALPDIKKLILKPEDEFMVLACDGIWNYMSSEEVVDFVKERIDDGFEHMSKICEELFELCLAPNTLGDGTGCDNMTAVIVRFKQPIQTLPSKLDPKECITAQEITVKTEPKIEPIPLCVNMETSPETSESPKPKSVKRSASPTPIDSSTSISSDSSTSIKKDKLDEHCHKRLKTEDGVGSSDSATTIGDEVDDMKVDCTSSSNGIAESETAAAAASIMMITKDDIGSTTESPIDT